MHLLNMVYLPIRDYVSEGARIKDAILLHLKLQLCILTIYVYIFQCDFQIYYPTLI